MADYNYIWERSGSCDPGACAAACCRSIIIPVEKRWCDDDTRRWLEYHGITIEMADPKYYQLHIPIACRMLNGESRCQVHESKPTTCRDYPVRPGGDPGCTYSFEKVHL